MNILKFKLYILMVSCMLISSPTFADGMNLAYRYEINVEYFGNIELVSIFTRKITRWPTGERIKVFIKPKNSFEHNVFASIVLGMTTYRYKKLMAIRVYDGGASPPIEKNSDEEMLAAIQNNEYSIGYINYGLAVLNIGGRNVKFIRLP